MDKNVPQMVARYRRLRDLPAALDRTTPTPSASIRILSDLAVVVNHDCDVEVARELLRDALAAAPSVHICDHERLMGAFFTSLDTIRMTTFKELVVPSLLECLRLYEISGHCGGELEVVLGKWGATLERRCVELYESVVADAFSEDIEERFEELAKLTPMIQDGWAIYMESLSRAAMAANTTAHGSGALFDLVLVRIEPVADRLLRRRQRPDFWDGLALTMDSAPDRYPRAARILDALGYIAHHSEQPDRGRAIAIGERIVSAIPELRDYFNERCSLPDLRSRWEHWR